MNMPEGIMLKKKMLKKTIWAVAGANEDPGKFGNRIYKKLRSRGYTVYPVNPKYESIEGNQCYKDLSSLPQKPEVIDMVVSPKRGRPILEEAARLGVEYVWFQPGTYDDELLEITKAKGLKYVLACVLVELG